MARDLLDISQTAVASYAGSGEVSVGKFRELALDVNLTALTGTTPTFQVFVDRLGADGVYYVIYTGASLNTPGTVTASLGVGASTNVSFGYAVRVRIAIAGTTPAATFTASLIGK